MARRADQTPATEGEDPAKGPPDKREAIEAAALELFTERGFHGTAVPAIAALARVGAGTIYRYFASKEQLVNAVYQDWKTRLQLDLEHAFPLGATPREQFHVYWTRLLRFVRGHPTAFRFLELHDHASYLDAASRELDVRLHEPVQAFFEAAAAARVTKEIGPELLLAIVWGAAMRLAKLQAEDRLELSADVVKETETALWEAVRA
jgi:AcrR family transcriptional regulator